MLRTLRSKIGRKSPSAPNVEGKKLTRRQFVELYENGSRDFSKIDFSGENLSEIDLIDSCSFRECNFSECNFNSTGFSGCIVLGCSFQNANLECASIVGGCWDGSDFYNASMSEAKIIYVIMQRSFFGSANLSGATLAGVDVSDSIFFQANLSGVGLGLINFANVRERTAELLRQGPGIELHQLPGSPAQNVVNDKTLEITTEDFAKRKELIARTENPSLRTFSSARSVRDFLETTNIGNSNLDNFVASCQKNLEKPSVFISYSTKDTDFCNKLYEYFSKSGIPTWYAPEEMKSGGTITEQLDFGLNNFDYIVLALSESSINSDWVSYEILQAMSRQDEEGRTILHPVRIVDYEILQGWELTDPKSNVDYAPIIRNLYIPDFTDWQNDAVFEKKFLQLARQIGLLDAAS